MNSLLTTREKIETIPFFDTLVTTLDSSLKNIRKIEENRFVLNATKSIVKTELKKKLLELAYTIATKCVLFFNYTKNQTKKAEVNFTITKLKRARDIDFAAKCAVILLEIMVYYKLCMTLQEISENLNNE